MSIPARAEAAVKGLVIWAGLGVAAGVICLAGLGFFIAAFDGWVSSYLPRDAAAAITGAALILLAILLLVIGSATLKGIKRRQPPLSAELRGFTGLAGSLGRLFGLIVAKDPRKSLVLAVIAGAVVEYVTSGGSKRPK